MEEASLVVVSPKRLHTARLQCCVTTRSLQGLEIDARKIVLREKDGEGPFKAGSVEGPSADSHRL